jgi:hypothetical protein
MVRTTILVLPALTLMSMGSASACAGADRAITSVAVKSVTLQGGASGMNQYNIVGTVINLGSQGQASSVLQFVDIYHNGDKLDSHCIPPLKPGQSSPFSYTFLRSTDAGKGTTLLRLRLEMRQPSPPGQEDCNPSNDHLALRF